MATSRIRVGIGSWTDKEYKGLLYPKGLPDEDRLKTYATWFDHVEVNASQHAIQPRDRVAKWVEQTPADFVFDFKLHKDFSVSPDKSAREGALLERFLGSAQPLIDARKLGAFLLLLPASFGPKRNQLEELDALAEKLSPQLLAIEFRNPGWIGGEQRERTMEYFRSRKLVWVAVDMPRLEGATMMPPIDEVTNPRLAYLRLHGRNLEWAKLKTAEEKHTYEYPESELTEIAARVRALAEKADEVHVVANNHAQDFAPKAALELRKMLSLDRDATKQTRR